jgi:hypothetical protein
MLHKNHWVTLLFALAVVTGLPVLAQTPAAKESRTSLHERAKKAGGKLIWRYRSHRNRIYSDVGALAKKSDVIVVGRTLGHRSTVRKDGKFITNDFLVRVQDVIKGNVTKGKSILISVPGGASRFPDGTYAVQIPISYRQPEDRTTYVFFLRKKNLAFKGHMLASETQGMFAFLNGRVEPADLVKSDPAVAKYQGMRASAFLNEIHKALTQTKH